LNGKKKKKKWGNSFLTATAEQWSAKLRVSDPLSDRWRRISQIPERRREAEVRWSGGEGQVK